MGNKQQATPLKQVIHIKQDTPPEESNLQKEKSIFGLLVISKHGLISNILQGLTLCD